MSWFRFSPSKIRLVAFLASFFSFAANGESKWSIKEGEKNGKPLLIRKRELPALSKVRRDHPFRLGFAVPLNASNEQGFPGAEELVELRKIEDLLVSVLEKKNTIHVLTVTGLKMQEFVFYTSASSPNKLPIKKLESSVVGHQLQYYLKADPDWLGYDTF